jgi:hypothetical protein
MHFKAEESLLLEATTKQQAEEGTTGWKDLTCAVMICKVCELVTAL